MFVYSVLEVAQHFHFDVLKLADPVAHLVELILSIHGPLFFFFLDLHLAELLVEELGLVQVFLLESDHFSCLKVLSQIFLLVLVNLQLELLLPLPFFFALVFERHHLFVRPLQLQRLLLLALLFRNVELFLEFILSSLLGLDPVLQVVYLALLDLLQPNRIVARLLDLLHELVLFFHQVVHSRQHLFLIFFCLLILVSSYSLWAFRAPGVDALLLGKRHARHADFGRRSQRLEPAVLRAWVFKLHTFITVRVHRLLCQLLQLFVDAHRRIQITVLVVWRVGRVASKDNAPGDGQVRMRHRIAVRALLDHRE